MISLLMPRHQSLLAIISVVSLVYYLQERIPANDKDSGVPLCSKSEQPVWEPMIVEPDRRWSFIKVSRLQDQANSVKDLTDTLERNSPNLLSQVLLVDGEYLRYTHHALFG